MTDRPTLIACYSGFLGGAERVLLDCAVRFPGPLQVACPEGALAGALRAAGVEHRPLTARSLHLRGARARHAAALIATTGELRRLIAAREPSALVAWGARTVLAAAALPRRGRPPLLAVHHDLHGPRLAAAIRLASGRADGVVAASRAIARQVGGAEILHPGVDLAAFTPAPLPEGPRHALVLGALVGWKRPGLALEAAARVPGLRLTLAGATLPGDGVRVEAALRARAARSDLAGRVTFAGQVGDPRPLLAASHCLLHCADAEPYGLALVEALAAGRPVVAPAAGGPLEIVTAGAGRLYRPGDVADAASALAAVLADPAAPAAARTRAEAEFDVEASARRFAAALAATVARRGAVA